MQNTCLQTVKTKQRPMRVKESKARIVFLIINTTFLCLFAVSSLLPFCNLLALSFSSKEAADANLVWFVPVGFTLDAYRLLITKVQFFRSFGISVARVVLGTVISLAVVTFGAYPLSREGGVFRGRMVYTVFFMITMFFSGGFIPTYILISKLKLMNNILALVLPTAMNAWNMVLLINFFRRVPQEMIESAKIEGAGHYTILFKFMLPVSLPALATVMLFTAVGHWNNWFDGLMYMDSKYMPLQSYIYHMINEQSGTGNNVVTNPEEAAMMSNITIKTLQSAQIFIAILPVLPLYLFAQKYFIKGLMLGSVKE
jgi:putative aldouronate transport system permease protein